MTDLERAFSKENLKRAYRWIQSNPDGKYKSNFRDSYAAYASDSDLAINRLRRDLLADRYEPSNASKIYLPKPSGGLRPFTLLTLDDQIVYQALVNIVADEMPPQIRRRYFKFVFGNLYAGKTSRFFYREWKKGYQAYSSAVVRFGHVKFRGVKSGAWAARFTRKPSGAA